MPQLDVVLNLFWFFFTIVIFGVLYFSNVYTYMPSFIRYIKFIKFYDLYLCLFSVFLNRLYVNLLLSDSNGLHGCTNLLLGLELQVLDVERSAYSLEVDGFELDSFIF